jgi:hypothetical protein
MGVYYPPEFLGFTHRQSYGAGPHALTFAVGETSATHFSRVFDAYFRHALRFQQRPSAARPAWGVDAVLVPDVEQVEMSDPALFGYAGSWKTELVYRFRMLDPTGLPIASWRVEGHGAEGGLDWIGFAIPRKAFNLALEDAGRNFIQGFTRETEIKSWLSSRGIQVSHRRGRAIDPPPAGGSIDYD